MPHTFNCFVFLCQKKYKKSLVCICLLEKQRLRHLLDRCLVRNEWILVGLLKSLMIKPCQLCNSIQVRILRFLFWWRSILTEVMIWKFFHHWLQICLKRKAKVKLWAGEPNKNKIATLSLADIEDIIDIKMPVMNTRNRDSIRKSIIGTAKSIGIEVK